MKFSCEVGYHTGNKLKKFGDDAFHPLDTEILFYFLESCLLATLRWVNRFSSFFQDMSYMAHEAIG